MLRTTTHSAAETEAFAQALAARLKPGDCLAFTGGMGAGKTAFVRGLAAGLGVSGEVSSPTFALVHEYPGTPTLAHFDLYRIADEEDLFSTGFYDYLDSGAILAVEWSERVPEAMPENAIYISIRTTGANTREITVTGGGPDDSRF